MQSHRSTGFSVNEIIKSGISDIAKHTVFVKPAITQIQL